MEFLGGVKSVKWTVIFYIIKDNKLNLSDSVINYLVKEKRNLSLILLISYLCYSGVLGGCQKCHMDSHILLHKR